MPDINLTLNAAFTEWGVRRIALVLLSTAKEWLDFLRTPVGAALFLLVAAVPLAGLWQWAAGPSLAVQIAQVTTVLVAIGFALFLSLARWLGGRTPVKHS